MLALSNLPLNLPHLALSLALCLPLAAGCSGDDSQGSASEGSTSTEATTSSSTSGASTSTSTTDATTSTTTGGVCEAQEPSALSIASDPDTYGTCGVPFEFFAKRKAGGISVERCTDDTCSSCDPELAYDLDLGSSIAVPEEACLLISHETKMDEAICRSRSFVISRIGESSPIIVATALTPEVPSSLTPATLTATAVSPQECSCSASWCCDDTLVVHGIEFTADGGDPVTIRPGFGNFKQLEYAGSSYEAVVTQAYEECDGGALRTGWYLRRL